MENNEGTDTTRLKSYLAGELDSEVVETEVIGTSINQVILLSTKRRQNAYVLRRPSQLKQSNIFSGLRQEYDILQRLEETSIPAPRPVLFCDDSSVIGDPFYIRSHLDGITIPLGGELPEQYRNPTARRAVAESLMETLAQIHTLDIGPFEEVCERFTPTARVRRDIDRLDRARDVTDREQSLLREVADWLLANAPPRSTTTLLHGDYKPDHVLVSETGPPEVVGVIDWEAATLGDPLVDLGYFLLFWRDTDDPTPSIEEIEEAHSESGVPDWLKQAHDHGFFPFTTDSGSPTRRKMVAAYEEHTNESFENERFYRALPAFTLATFWEFCHKQSVEQGDDSPWEPRIDYMTAVAASIVDGRFEL